MTDLQKLYEQLSELEQNNCMDYLEKMREKFRIQDLIAEEEMKQFLEENK